MKCKRENDLIGIEKGPLIGIRHVQVVLMFLLTAVAYGTRVCLSVAIVAMTEKQTSFNHDVPTYKWTNKSVILSSFYWGYILPQILAGEICRRYGSKKILIGAMFIDSLSCVSIPIAAASMGSSGVIACRIMQGLSQGFFLPTVYNLLGRWVPSSERALLAAVANGGMNFGTIVTMSISGWISSSSFGWPAIFYGYSSLGFIWNILWIILGSDSPHEHNSITDKELKYIKESVGVTECSSEKMNAPWKEILISIPFWAIIVCHIGQDWGYTTLLTEIPNYMSKIMKYDIEANGVLSAMPFLATFLLSFVFSHLADYLINKQYMTEGNTRKFLNTIGSVPPAATLIIICFLPSDASILTVIMLIATLGFNAATSGGYVINHLDLSPRYAGILLGIGNTTATISSILAPLLVHFVVTDETDKTQWGIIFITSAIFYLATNIFYVIFGSGKIQKWNYIKNDNVIETAVTKTEQDVKDT